MDGAVMEGPLFLQSQRFGTKRWRKTWAVLYPASPHGVARLEFFDHKGSSSRGGRGGSRRLDCKMIRLAECVSVVPVTVESPPEPGAVAFRLDTAQRSHLLAADAVSSTAWVQTLCRTAFPKGGWALAQTENQPKFSALEMLENSLYSPTWEGSQFWVTSQKTEASERCGLQGSYILRVEAEKLTLLTLGAQSQILEPLLFWPYTLLRRYGRDKVMFSFEAGRRCPSGPGTFTFQARLKEEGYELPYNPATDDYAVPPPRSPKPAPAPKPQGLILPESGTTRGSGSKGFSSDTALYSQVQKSGTSGAWDCGLSKVGNDRAGVKSEGST